MLAAGCGPVDRSDTIAKRDVVVFLLDAARADHFGCYGYAKNTTPNIDALAGSSVVFGSAISDAASTFPSVSALMTGMSTGKTQLLRTQALRKDLPTIAEKAMLAGYRTYAYSENPFVTKKFGFNRGFQHFDQAFPHDTLKQLVGELPQFDSPARIEQVLDWMAEESADPFFAYIHLLRPHNPYTPPKEFVERFAAKADPAVDGGTEHLLEMDRRGTASADELERTVELYDANLAYGDELFAVVMNGLRERGLLDNSIIVVLSDHGEGFLEHGRMLHTSTVFDEMVHVPVIIHYPGGHDGMRLETPVQLSDVGIGLATIFEQSADEIRPDGTAFTSAAVARGEGSKPLTLSWTLPRFGLVGVRSRAHKLVVDVGPDGCLAKPVALYDLEADPAEKSELDPVGPAATHFERYFRENGLWECEANASQVEVELDAKTADWLRALGYLE